MRRFTVPILLALLTLGASAQSERPKSWRQQAMDALMAGDLERASQLYEKWTEADPGDAVSLYNLACCDALLNRLDDAMEALQLAAEAGWSDSAHTAEDPDLQPLRSRPEFSKALADIARNARTRYGGYTMHICMQERYGQYLIILPDDYDPQRSYPLVILLHGYGQSPEQFAKVASYIGTGDFIYAIPEGPYAALDGEGRAFSHLRESADFREDTRSAIRTADWIVRVADDVKRHYPVAGERFWLAGFSQGGAMAHAMAAFHPQRVAGYMAHGGYLIPDLIQPDQFAAEKAAGVQVLVTHGEDDIAVGLEEGIHSVNVLKHAGLDVRFETVKGAHEFSPEVGRLAGQWLREKAKR